MLSGGGEGCAGLVVLGDGGVGRVGWQVLGEARGGGCVGQWAGWRWVGGDAGRVGWQVLGEGCRGVGRRAGCRVGRTK